MKTISFIIPSRDNLKYLKWCYNSIRKNLGYRHQICFGDDASTDGTWDWLQEIAKKDINITIHKNDSFDRWGLTIYYDYLVKEYATNDIVIFFHADMYACPDMDKEILKHLVKGKTIVCPTRIEPPLHPEGAEKIVKDFGMEPENFKEYELLNFIKWDENYLGLPNVMSENNYPANGITEGIFAPWAIYKDDFFSIGGHDKLFAPQSREDSDIFNRFHLAGFKFVQTWGGFVYHLTSRGSRFRDGVGKNSAEWIYSNQKNMRNFIRKWGTGVQHDQFLKPSVSPKYDICFVVYNCDLNMAYQLEIWCSSFNSDLSEQERQIYIKTNQPGTLYKLDEKLKTLDAERENDVIVKFDGSKLTNVNFQYLIRLNEILTLNEETGQFELDIFDIQVRRKTSYEYGLIKIGE